MSGKLDHDLSLLFRPPQPAGVAMLPSSMIAQFYSACGSENQCVNVCIRIYLPVPVSDF